MDLPPGWRRAGPFRSNAGFRQPLARSRDEAELRHHRRIRPSHILAGILYSPDARVLAVLDALGISLDVLRAQSTMTLGAAIPPNDYGPDLAYTRRGVAVLHTAIRSAERMGHDWLGAVHLLVAISDEGWGSGFRVLRDMGADHERLWRAVDHVGATLPPTGSSEPPLIMLILSDAND